MNNANNTYLKKNNASRPVIVTTREGKLLYPTFNYGKVRLLLKARKAVVASKDPFKIRLLYTPESMMEKNEQVNKEAEAVHGEQILEPDTANT